MDVDNVNVINDFECDDDDDNDDDHTQISTFCLNNVL